MVGCALCSQRSQPFGGHIKNLLILKRLGVWLWELVGWPAVYIPLFGIVFSLFSFITGYIIVYLAQVAIAFGYLIRYDRNSSLDIMGIDWAKRHLKALFGIKDSWSPGKVAASTSSLLILMLMASVPTLFLCYRREGERGFRVSGIIFILVATVVKTVLYYKPNVVLWASIKYVIDQATRSVFG